MCYQFDKRNFIIKRIVSVNDERVVNLASMKFNIESLLIIVLIGIQSFFEVNTILFI